MYSPLPGMHGYGYRCFQLAVSTVLLCAVVLANVKLLRIPRPVILGIAVVAGCALALQLHNWLWLHRPATFGWFVHTLRVVVLQWGLVVAAYYFIERSARAPRRCGKRRLERHRIEAQMLEARLQVMQAQVEPHFLFNTLAHVQRLYQTDPARGRSMLDSFCGYVRAALPQMRGNGSTLDGKSNWRDPTWRRSRSGWVEGFGSKSRYRMNFSPRPFRR